MKILEKYEENNAIKSSIISHFFDIDTQPYFTTMRRIRETKSPERIKGSEGLIIGITTPPYPL